MRGHIEVLVRAVTLSEIGNFEVNVCVFYALLANAE